MTHSEDNLPSVGKALSGPAKAAVLLLLLGEELSGDVVKSLNDDDVKKVSQAIADLKVVDESLTEAVLEESHYQLQGDPKTLLGGVDYMKKVIESAYSPDVARSMVREISLEARLSNKDTRILREADPQTVATLIQNEHPQTVAVILGMLGDLDPSKATEVIRNLPEGLRPEVCLRLAQLDQVSQTVKDKVTQVIVSKLREAGQYDQDGDGPLRSVAEIFNRMERRMSRSLLENIEKEDGNLALAIRNLMFTFDDILLLNDAVMQKVIQGVDKKALPRALKGAPEELSEHFFRNMSTRAANMLQEDIGALGPIQLKEVEVSRQEVLSAIRQMEVDGLIELGGAGGDEYVV